MNFCLGFGQNFQQFQWTATHVCHSILTHLVLVVLGEKPLPYAHVLEDLVPSGWGFLKEIIDWGCSYPCFPPGQSWDCCSPSQREVTSGSLDHMTSGPGPETPAKQLPWWVGGWVTLLHFPSLFSLFHVAPKPLTALFSSSVCCWGSSPRRAALLSRAYETSHAVTMRLWHATISSVSQSCIGRGITSHL